MDTYLNKYHIDLQQGQWSNEARINAQLDLRNAFTLATARSAMGEDLPLGALANFDATQFHTDWGTQHVMAAVNRDRPFHHPVNRKGCKKALNSGVWSPLGGSTPSATATQRRL
jgi:hypothetical protein